jgi:hypothetical protein
MTEKFLGGVPMKMGGLDELQLGGNQHSVRELQETIRELMRKFS